MYKIERKKGEEERERERGRDCLDEYLA